MRPAHGQDQYHASEWLYGRLLKWVSEGGGTGEELAGAR